MNEKAVQNQAFPLRMFFRHCAIFSNFSYFIKGSSFWFLFDIFGQIKVSDEHKGGPSFAYFSAL